MTLSLSLSSHSPSLHRFSSFTYLLKLSELSRNKKPSKTSFISYLTLFLITIASHLRKPVSLMEPSLSILVISCADSRHYRFYVTYSVFFIYRLGLVLCCQHYVLISIQIPTSLEMARVLRTLVWMLCLASNFFNTLVPRDVWVRTDLNWIFRVCYPPTFSCYLILNKTPNKTWTSPTIIMWLTMPVGWHDHDERGSNSRFSLIPEIAENSLHPKYNC